MSELTDKKKRVLRELAREPVPAKCLIRTNDTRSIVIDLETEGLIVARKKESGMYVWSITARGKEALLLG